MGIREKTFIPNRIYFITFAINRWQKILISDKYAELFFKWFKYQRENYKNKIHGYVIMPTHFHCLIYISDESPPLSKLIQNAKRFLAYGIVKILEEENNQEVLKLFASDADRKKGAKHKVFENRFDSKLVEDANIFREKLNYIHNNPCNKGWEIVESIEKYRYSSASNYLRGEGIYDVDVVVI